MALARRRCLPTDAAPFWLLPASSDYIIISITPVASLASLGDASGSNAVA
jgi:hypothetical protein